MKENESNMHESNVKRVVVTQIVEKLTDGEKGEKRVTIQICFTQKESGLGSITQLFHTEFMIRESIT